MPRVSSTAPVWAPHTTEDEKTARRIAKVLEEDPWLLWLLRHAEDHKARTIRRRSGVEETSWFDSPKAVRDGLETLRLVGAVELVPWPRSTWKTVRTSVGSRMAFDVHRPYRIAYTVVDRHGQPDPRSRGGSYTVLGRSESDAVERLRTTYLARLSKRDRAKIVLSDPTLVVD